MRSTVNVDDQTKARLEELQAEIERGTGQKLTLGEIVSRLTEAATESRPEFGDPFETSTFPLSEDEKAAMARCRFSSGKETDEDDIDDILYG